MTTLQQKESHLMLDAQLYIISIYIDSNNLTIRERDKTTESCWRSRTKSKNVTIELTINSNWLLLTTIESFLISIISSLLN